MAAAEDPPGSGNRTRKAVCGKRGLGRGGSRRMASRRLLRQVTLSERGAMDGLGAETSGLTEA